MQCFDRTGPAPRRDEIGAELVALCARHGLATFETLGRLVRLQARCAPGDFTAADRHAAAATALAVRHEAPLVGVFTGWYAALRLDATGRAPVAQVAAAYRGSATLLDGAGVLGLAHGLLPLALLCLRVRQALPLHFDPHTDTAGAGGGLLTLGAVSGHLADLADGLGRTRERFDETRRRTGE